MASHSFNLEPEAARLVDAIPNTQKGKRVSAAIEWFYQSPIVSSRFRDDYDYSSHGVPSVEALWLQLQQMTFARDALQDAIFAMAPHPEPPRGGLRAIIARIWPF